jgi:hypothetical protein
VVTASGGKQPTLGWTIAHVWDRRQDWDAYSRLEAEEPIEPDHCAEIRWNDLTPVNDPVGFFRDEFASANCRRCSVLKPLMPRKLLS